MLIEDLSDTIRAVAKRNGLDENELLIRMAIETGFNMAGEAANMFDCYFDEDEGDTLACPEGLAAEFGALLAGKITDMRIIVK